MTKRLIKKALKCDISILSNPDIIKVKTNSTGKTALHWLAIMCNDSKKMLTLLNHKHICDIYDDIGMTPLHYLCENSNLLTFDNKSEIICKLLLHNDINKKGKHLFRKHTPFDILCRLFGKNKMTLLRKMVKNGKNITTIK